MRRSFLIAILGALTLWSQSTSRISGTVTDSSGALVVGANVTLIDEGTKAQLAQIGFFGYQPSRLCRQWLFRARSTAGPTFWTQPPCKRFATAATFKPYRRPACLPGALFARSSAMRQRVPE